MNWLTEKPFISFLILIPIIMIIGFLNRKETLDINVHDTYYVINNLHLAIILSIFLAIISLGYFLIKIFSIPLINWMTISHILITIFGMLIIYILFRIQLNFEVKSYDIESILKYSKTIQRVNFTLFSVIVLLLRVTNAPNTTFISFRICLRKSIWNEMPLVHNHDFINLAIIFLIKKIMDLPFVVISQIVCHTVWYYKYYKILIIYQNCTNLIKVTTKIRSQN